LYSGLNFTKYFEAEEQFKASSVHLFINSFLLLPIPPFWRVYYHGFEEVEEEIKYFASRGFNHSATTMESRDVIEKEHPTHWVLNVRFQPFFGGIIGADVLFVPTTVAKMSGITCAGVKTRISLHDYVLPYTWACWVAILSTCVIISVLFVIVPEYRGIKDLVPFLLFSLLLEVSYDIDGPKFKLRAFRLALSLFILLGVVLTNAYKGIVTTSLVMPFDESGLDSLHEAIQVGYKSVVEIDRSLYASCCASQGKMDSNFVPFMQGIWFDLPVLAAGVVETCGEYGVLPEQIQILMTTRKMTHDLVVQIMGSGKLKNFDETKLDKDSRLYLKWAKATVALDCGLTVEEALESCQDNFFIGNVDYVKLLIYLDKFNPIRRESPLSYEIEDTINFIPALTWGITLTPHHVNRERLLRDVNIFVESGLNARIQRSAELLNLRRMLNENRHKNGKLEDQTMIPVPLNLSTRILTIFYIYLICILITIMAFLSEMRIIVLAYLRNLVVNSNRH